jgi:hypothetical protein
VHPRILSSGERIAEGRATRNVGHALHAGAKDSWSKAGGDCTAAVDALVAQSIHGVTVNSQAGASASNAYRVRAMPATFLIGPDGRILAKNLRGSELTESERKALADRKLFPG